MFRIISNSDQNSRKKVKTLSQIRNAFIEFFKGKQHEHYSSSPLVPVNDSSLMFTNSGMVQFKRVFTGQEQIASKRIVTCQKAMRAGGKHNDLENVGYTTRHHTLFEMLGNFSFGDYFKEEAISYAWELLTKVYLLNKNRLLLTVHSSDDQSRSIWKKVSGLSEDRIITINSDDNFWSMGDTGPCGPCSEIFYDCGPELPGGKPGSADQDGPRYVEIWNLVFMQYEQTEQGRVPLAKCSIDTGMGLERMAAVMQGVFDNYETDLFRSIVGEAVSISGKGYDASTRLAYRVISDHIRAIIFLIAEGVLPGNTGQGYVLRKIMRRAIKYAKELSKTKEVLCELVPFVVASMKDAYPEIESAKQPAMNVIFEETGRFEKVLGRGCSILQKLTKDLPNGAECSGEIAFELYDTYGFPLELTRDILNERKISISTQEFEACMAHQRDMSKKCSNFSATDFINHLPSTNFVRDKDVINEAEVLAILVDGTSAKEVGPNQSCTIFLDSTPFYAQSGGQVGDTGRMSFNGMLAEVTDTKKVLERLHAHEVRVIEGTIEAGQKLEAKIDSERRRKITCNHSATHLLHSALREVFSEQYTQKGSLVREDNLRFDFTCSEPLSLEQLHEVENLVNDVIARNMPATTELSSYQEAIKSGALALFGEKYHDVVRTVAFGSEDKFFSKELCGGTHVKSSGEIGLFKIVKASAIASGIKRIEALTGRKALAYLQNLEEVTSNLSTVLKAPIDALSSSIQAVLAKNRNLELENKDLKLKSIVCTEEEFNSSSHRTKYGQLLYKALENIEPQVLREAILESARKLPFGIIVFATKLENVALVFVSVGQEIEKNLRADKLVNKIACRFGAKGGGSAKIAQVSLDKSHFEQIQKGILEELQ